MAQLSRPRSKLELNMFLRHPTGFHGRILKGTLERSLKTDVVRETRPRKLGRPFGDNFPIFTLDPNKFAEKKQQRLPIGNQQGYAVYVSLLKQSSPVKALSIQYDPNYQSQTCVNRPSFPPNTKAFLYYHMSPEKPPIAGELRFRVASSDNHASFERGSDLLRPNGQIWSYSLYSLQKKYPLLYEKLREDRLVPDDLDTALSNLPSTLSHRRSRILYTINDTFILNFSASEMCFFVITEQRVEYLRLREPFIDQREKCAATTAPYTGSALVRFERSTLPEHKGTRTIVLRFLKIITPVKCVIPLYDGFISCPKEGELHRRTKYISESVWSVDIDKSKGGRPLQLLWDT